MFSLIVLMHCFVENILIEKGIKLVDNPFVYKKKFERNDCVF